MMHQSRFFLVVLVVGLSLGCGVSVPDALAPDMILVNGKIVTVDEDFSVAEALAIRDGKFVAVGGSGAIGALAGSGTEVIDLEGKTVLPGFNDGHGHVTLTWGRVDHPIEARLLQANNMQEVLDLVREKMETTEPYKIVFLDRGISSPGQLEENRWPNRYDLDKVSDQRPILLTVGGAGSDVIANSGLLRDLGIDRNTPQPWELGLDGEIVTDPRTGEPTGVFLGWAGQGMVRRTIQLYPLEVQAGNIKRAALEMVKYGITTVGDPNTTVAGTLDNVPFIRAYERLANQGELLVRVNCIPRIPLLTIPVTECVKYLDTFPYEPGFGNDRFLLRQVKIVVNSSSDDFRLPHDDVKAVVKAVHQAGWQLMVHTRGGESFDVAMEAIEEAYQDRPDGPERHLITHAANPTDENLEILARRGILVDPQPGQLYNYADDAEETFEEPGRPSYGPIPLRTYLDRGVGLMISSDQAPVGPLFHVFEAVNRVRRTGKPIVPEEAITVEEAIRATTITPAYSVFQEDLKGSIEPGKLADLVILGKDILTVPSMEIKDIPILRTMVGGEFVYTNPDQDPNQEVKYWYPITRQVISLPVPAE